MKQHKAFTRGSEEWLAFRRGYITATEISVLLGLNKYNTPRKLIEDKKNPSFTANVYTRMGKILEPAVANLTEEIVGIGVHSYAKENKDVVFFDDALKLSATPDGYITTEEGLFAVELKTTSKKNLEAWDTNIPLHYAVQLLQQMHLTDSVGGFLTIMTPEYPSLPALVYKTSKPVPLDLIQGLSTLAHKFFVSYNRPDCSFRRDKDIENIVKQYILNNFEKIHSDIVQFEMEDTRPWWET